MAKTNKKTFIIVLFLVLIVALGIGYAAFSDSLTITGTANAKGKFDLEFVEDGSGTAGCKIVTSEGIDTANSGVVVSADKNTMTVTVKDMGYPGAGAQVRAVIKNAGSVPAIVKSLPVTSNITGDGNAIKIIGLDAITTNHPTIQPNGTCTVDFTVEWDPTVTTLTDATNGDSCTFTLQINYEQDTNTITVVNTHTDVNPTV